MDLTTVYWFLCVALAVATCVMAAGLVSFVITIIERIHRITGRNSRI